MKYIVYCRKSTDEKDRQILSIEAQVAELKEFASRENLEIVGVIDEAKTAKVPGREKFELVLKKIDKGEAQGILSWHPDRLARNSIDGGKLIYLLDTGKLQDLKFPTFWFENTPQGKFMLSIAFGQSKYYIDNLSENVKRGLRQKLRNGVLPAKAPWGYKNNEELGTIEIDEVKSKILKKAFELFADGEKSFTDISLFLYKNGFTDKNGKAVKIDRLKNALSNKFYIGIIYYGGEYYEGVHKLFITKQLFDRVQKQFKLTERGRPNNKHKLSFMGMINCGECGAYITGEKKIKFYKGTNREATYIYYSCTKKLGKCSQMPIPEEDLALQITKIISDVALPENWANDWYKWIERDETIEEQSREENLQKLAQELKTLDQKLNLLLDSYLDNVIDAAKIARAKNTCSDLAIGAKTVGSNFFLTNRRLVPEYKRGFAELCVPPPAQSQTSARFADSHSEPVDRIGLSLFALRKHCFTTKLHRHSGNYRPQERVSGVGPPFLPWEGSVEPINYTRNLQIIPKYSKPKILQVANSSKMFLY
ncbi:MAG: Recombinase [Microgenomates group bacterium Gr01-1014_7]|nr:MAG: Recombinase [Microgenomates group bacterium Gr01-1014_7]